jgi:hypothetical protein
LSSFSNGYEVILAGDESRPDPHRLRVAREVTARVSELMRAVIAHLDAHLDYRQLGSSGAWHLEGIEFGRDRSQPAEVFEVDLTTDEYGDWYDCETWFVTCALAESAQFEIRSYRGGWFGRKLAEARRQAEPDAAPGPAT